MPKKFVDEVLENQNEDLISKLGINLEIEIAAKYYKKCLQNH